MIKLNFTYQGQPFQQGEVDHSLRQHPALVSTLLTRLAKVERFQGELVLDYGQSGPKEFQIEQLNGVAPQKLVKLFSKMGFRPRTH